jgi:hypothetical protein
LRAFGGVVPTKYLGQRPTNPNAAVIMRVFDALSVGLEGCKPHLPQRGSAR